MWLVSYSVKAEFGTATKSAISLAPSVGLDHDGDMGLVGVTGISGAGKPTVCDVLKSRNLAAIDTDWDGFNFWVHRESGDPMVDAPTFAPTAPDCEASAKDTYDDGCSRGAATRRFGDDEDDEQGQQRSGRPGGLRSAVGQGGQRSAAAGDRG